MPVQAAPALLLLLSAYGLRRGRRLAWWLAVVINLTVLAAGVWVSYAVSSGPGMHIAGLRCRGPGDSAAPGRRCFCRS